MVAPLTFPTCGVTIDNPTERLEAFLEREYAWYDGFEDSFPNEVLPFDVLAAVGIRTDEALAKPHTCCHSPGLDRSQSRFRARSKCGHPVERN
jgi:hypothetical protein